MEAKRLMLAATLLCDCASGADVFERIAALRARVDAADQTRIVSVTDGYNVVRARGRATATQLLKSLPKLDRPLLLDVEAGERRTRIASGAAWGGVHRIWVRCPIPDVNVELKAALKRLQEIDSPRETFEDAPLYRT